MRLLATLLFLASFILGGAATAVAQDEEVTPFASLGLPELAVTVTPTGYEGIPAELAAGRYLVTMTVGDDLAEMGGGIGFVQAPPDMSTDDYLAAYNSSEDEGDDDATAADGEPTDFLFTAHYAGGTYAFGGQSQIVIDLTPGEWIAWPDDSEAPQEPVVFQATGEMPAELTEPESAATISVAKYLISVTDGSLVAGSQVVRIDNVGAQPHFLGWFYAPDGATRDQIQVALDDEMEAEMSGTPVAYTDLNPDEDMELVTFTATQSPGTSTWIVVDLTAGSNGLACFLPDQGDGLEHAFHGMFSVVEVGA